ncbi:MAG: hypothetical protein EXR09_11955 [Acetobacteraceae bacterium]|nr:hypothetical protein [Acetobacteraceae bacterium]
MGAPHTGQTPHCGYVGNEGLERLGALSPDYRAFSLGQQPAPVNLAEVVDAQPGGAAGLVHPGWRDISRRIPNDGHTIKVNCDPGNGTQIAGAAYNLGSFIFIIRQAFSGRPAAESGMPIHPTRPG